jgi:hypothetical protein
VTVEAEIMKATDTITMVEGYDATRIFLETVGRVRDGWARVLFGGGG